MNNDPLMTLGEQGLNEMTNKQKSVDLGKQIIGGPSDGVIPPAYSSDDAAIDPITNKREVMLSEVAPNVMPTSIQEMKDQASEYEKKNNLNSFSDITDKFGNHVLNSFLTENIIGQYANKKLLFTDDIGEADPNFDPVKSPLWKAGIEYVDSNHLAELVGDSKNENDMRQRLSMYITEASTRKEVGEYMSSNPITGFVGIGAASMLDVTSLIPVAGLARITGIAKVVGNVSKVTKFIGGAVFENLVQDLTQEAILTNNSDIRRFSDGDMLYGAVGGVLLGGAAGSFRFLSAEKKFLKMAKGYAQEKNLTMLDNILAKAEAEKYPVSTMNKLNMTKTKLIEELDNSMRLKVSEQLDNYNTVYKETFLANQKVAVSNKQIVFESSVDDTIDSIKQKSKTSISDIKTKHKEERVAFRETIKPLESNAQGIRNRIKDLKQSTSPKALSKADNLTKELKTLESKINDMNKQNKKLASKHKNELSKVVKDVNKLEINSGSNETIKLLEKSKKVNLDSLLNEFNSNKAALDLGEGIPTPDEWNIKGFNTHLEEMGIPKQFTTKDDLDLFLGLKFSDSPSVFSKSGNQSMGAAQTKFLTKSGESLTKGLDDSQLAFIQDGIRLQADNPDFGLNAIATKKDSFLADVLRKTKMYEFFQESSWWGNLVNSMNSLKNSADPITAGLANQLFSNKGGRVEAAGMAVEEITAKYRNIAGGGMKKAVNNMISDLKVDMKTSKVLRDALGLKDDWIDTFRVGGADFEATVTKLVRDEMLDNGVTARVFGDSVATKVNKFIDDQAKLIDDMTKRAKELGVEGSADIISDRNYMHRSWDNDVARGFVSDYKEAALIDLVREGLYKSIVKTIDPNTSAELLEQIKDRLTKEARAFAFGLTNVDLKTNHVTADAFNEFLYKIENGNWDGIIDMNKFKDKAAKELEALDKSRKQLLATKKKLDLNASVFIETPNGPKEFFLKDLLDSNLINSQSEYINYMAPRLALAEKGITSMSKLDDMIEVAVASAVNSGDVAKGKYVGNVFNAFKAGLRSGGASVTDASMGARQALSLVKKYNYARLMQYTGISSMAEMGMSVSEAGYRATWDAVGHSTNHWYRTKLLAGVSKASIQDELTDALGALTGVGLEGFNTAATRSSKSTIYKKGAMAGVEKTLDNIGRVTHKTTSWIESATRRVTMNALALNMSNVMLGKSGTKGYLGGLTDFNLVELGLATRVNGVVTMSPKFTAMKDNITKYALDLDGNKASVSGKRIASFDFAKWDQGVVREFGDVLTQRANHILVNPDVSTQSLWHTSLVGSIINQFKSFSQAAHAKVAMHNLNASIEAVKMREPAELIKGVHKLVLGAAFGKVSLMTYSAIHNAGRDDYEQRMAEAMSISDFRDWTKALGRGSVITGLDSSIDTGIGFANAFQDKGDQMDSMFSNSTIGQSRSALDLRSTATGQLATGLVTVGELTAKGKFEKAGNKLINISPIRRAAGVNQLLNLMGVD